MKMTLFVRCAAVAALSLGLSSTATVARAVTFTIDSNQSELNLTATGMIFGGVLNVTEQHPNEETSYTGTLEADFPNGPGPGGSVSFPGGSAAAAENLCCTGFFGTELPVSPSIGGGAGTDPANYGLTLDAPVGIDLPAVPIPDVGEIDLGTLESVQIDVALRDIVFDVTMGLTDLVKPINGAGEFDASGGIGSGVQLELADGYLDLNGSLIIRQDDFIAYGAALAALNALALAVPDLGLTVDGNPDGNIFTTEVGLGIGARLELDLLTGAMLPNGAATPGTVTWDAQTGDATIVLPLELTLPDLGMAAGLFDLDLGFDGQFVASATGVPEPSVWLLLASVAALGTVRPRSR